MLSSLHLFLLVVLPGILVAAFAGRGNIFAGAGSSCRDLGSMQRSCRPLALLPDQGCGPWSRRARSS
jgi:hypothetical protein